MESRLLCRLIASLGFTSFALTFALALVFPALAVAQSANTGAIAGVVKDASGAVMPGVTVEAESPSLIERRRTAVTDGQGIYKIIDLRPGTYLITFSLQGFATLKRDNVELTAAVTATVNGELKVGEIAETVTVSGASSIVDVQNVQTVVTLSRQVQDALPTSKNLSSYASLILGAQLTNPADQDVGGNRGDGAIGGFSIHGAKQIDSKFTIDGMPFTQLNSDGAAFAHIFFPDTLALQETTIQTGGGMAESETAGAQINMLSKDGGNRFASNITLTGTNSSLQASNLTDALRSRGVTTNPGIKKVYDVGGTFGGPIAKDKLWFFTAHRWWGAQNVVPGVYSQTQLNSLTYTADMSKPAFSSLPNEDHTVRFTWQAAEKHKVTITQMSQDNCICFRGIAAGTQSPESTPNTRTLPGLMTAGTWNYPRTNRLLFEAGGSMAYIHQSAVRQPGVTTEAIPVTDLNAGFTWNAYPNMDSGMYGDGRARDQALQRFSVTYVTGSHAVKAGLLLHEGWAADTFTPNVTPYGPLAFRFRSGVPDSINEFATPVVYRYRLMPNQGIFVQDQWTLRRTTLNLGVRYDHVRAYVPAEQQSAVPAFGIPARSFAEVDNVPNWHDVVPRFGLAYDVFGDGKTAVKASLGKYNISQLGSLAIANAPSNQLGTSATRTWTDVNKDFVPNCDFTNPQINGECGRLSNVNLGLPIPSTTYDPDYLTGSGKRGYMWQGALSVQQQLAPGFAVKAEYFRTSYGNFTATTNRALTPADFSSYCFTAPTDTRLGAVNGQQVCGLYDIVPTKFGQVNNFITEAANFGEQTEIFNGIDIGFNARFLREGVLQGGVSTGRTVTDNCAIVQANPQIALTVGGGAAPRTDAFCRVTNPWSAQTQFKLVANLPLPWWGIQASANYQNLPGTPLYANLAVTGAQTTLGRLNQTTTVALLQPFTLFEDRLNQFDLRFAKVVRSGRYRIRGMLDLYNVLNASNVLAVNTTYGTNWLRPTSILGARLLKLGAQIDF